MMLQSYTTFALLSALASTQSSVISLLILNADPQTLLASVITANPSTTEYLLGCSTGVDPNDCGFNPPVTFKHAGSVYGASLTDPEGQFTYSWECTAAPESAVCVTTAGGEQANDLGVATATLAASELTYMPVAVTADAYQLAGSTAVSSSKASRSAGSPGSASAAVTGATTSSTSASGNRAHTAGVGLGLVGLAAVAMAL